MAKTSRALAHVLLAAALFAVVADADARGRRGSFRSSSSGSAARAATGTAAESEARAVNVLVRNSDGGSSGSSQESGLASSMPAFTRARPVLAPRAADKPYTAEEIARHEAALASYEKDQAAYANAVKLAAAKAEAQRVADEQAAAEKAARKAAEANAEDAKAAAALAEKKRADAAVAADVARVLDRAKADHPLLATPEGEPVLRMIHERQQALVARGMYPGIAMVEAVADHTSMLAPRAKPQAVQATAPVPATETSPAFNGCYWKTPSVWSCR